MIEEKMDVAIKAARADPRGLYWVFFDEVNTCEYLGVFNEILCEYCTRSRVVCPLLLVIYMD